MTDPVEGSTSLVPVGPTAPAPPPRGRGSVVALTITGLCVGVAVLCVVLVGGTGGLVGALLAGFAALYAWAASAQLKVPAEPGDWWARVHAVEGTHDRLVALAHQRKAEREPWARDALAPLRDAAIALAAEARSLDDATWHKRPADRRRFDLRADQADTAAAALSVEFERVVGHFAATEGLPRPPAAGPLDALNDLVDWAVARYQAECALAGQPVEDLAATAAAPEVAAARAMDALTLLGDSGMVDRAVAVLQATEAAIRDARIYGETLTAMSDESRVDSKAGDRYLAEARATEQSLTSQLGRLAAAASAAAQLAARNGTLSDAARQSPLLRMQQTTDVLRDAADHGDDVAHRLGGDGDGAA